jgi:hypothetical protein
MRLVFRILPRGRRMDSLEQACYNHPKRLTTLRCNRCGRPICAQCVVRTPVGYRCKTCVREQQKIFETARWYDYPAVFCATGIIAGVGALIAGYFGFWGVLVAIVAGFIAERAAHWAARYRRGRFLWLAAVGGAIAATLAIVAIPIVVFALFLTAEVEGSWFAGLLNPLPIFILVYGVIMTVALAGRWRGRW